MIYWKTKLTFFLMTLAIWFNWDWFWAVLIFLGLLNTLLTDEIHFVETIKKDQSPKFYWIVVVFMSSYSILLILQYLKWI